MVQGSKKMDMDTPHVAAGTSQRHAILATNVFGLHGDEQRVLQLLLDKLPENVVLQDKTGNF